MSGTQGVTTYQVRYRVVGTQQWTAYGQPTTNLQQSLTGLQPNTTYQIQILATNPQGQVASSIVTATTSTRPPAAPGNPKVSNIKATSVVLNWPASTTGSAPITYQPMYRVSGGGSFTAFGNPILGLSATITGLTAATAYDFEVLATNTAGGSTSPVTTATTAPAGTAPSAPTGLALTNVQQTQVTLNWTASSGTAPITYQPQYRRHGDVTWINAPAQPITGTAQTITGLVAGVQYDFQVIATNAAGSATSAVFVASTAAATVIPGAPGTPVASAISATGLTLTWSAPTSGTTPFTYEVQYRVTGTATFANFGAAISALTEAITGLSPSTSYDFQIVARNSAGATTSGTASATTLAAVTAPTAPTGLVASAITQSGLHLAWTASATGSAPITYQPQYRVTGSGTAFSNAPSTTTVSQNYTGLTPNTTYDLQVVASNSAGSATSAVITATTAAASTTWDPANTALTEFNLSNSNLTLNSKGGVQGASISTTSRSGGKWYVEVTPTLTTASQRVGLVNAAADLTQPIGSTADGVGIDPSGRVFIGGVQIGTGARWTAAGAISLAIDETDQKLFYRVAGGSWGTAAAAAESGTQEVGTAGSGPVIDGPASAHLPLSKTLALTGVTVSDTLWPHVGTAALNVGCGSGTVAMTLNGVAVAGSGTNTINVNDSDVNIQAMVQTISYTAPGSGATDSVTVQVWDQQGAVSTMTIPIRLDSTSDPVKNVGGFDLSTLNAGPYFLAYSNSSNNDTVTADFGATPTAFAPPTGYSTWDGLASAPPTNMAAPAVTGVTSSAATVTWAAPLNGAAPFTYQPLYRVHGSANFIAFGAPTSLLTTTITGLSSGTNYDFAVTASNVGGSTTSPVTSALTKSATVLPGQVGGTQSSGGNPNVTGPQIGASLVGQPLYVTGITLSDTTWPTTSNNTLAVSCTSGTVRMQVGGSNVAGSGTKTISYASTPGNVQAAAASLVYTAPASGTSDSIVVKLTDQGGASGTITIKLTLAALSSGAPTSDFTVQLGTIGSNSVALSWSAPSSGTAPINYAVQYRPKGTTKWTQTAQTTALSETIAGLAAGTAYDFQVAASNTAGIGYSNIVSATTSQQTGAVVLPGDATGVQAGRIADMMELFGVNTFSSTSSTSNTWGTFPSDYSQQSVINALNFLTQGSGMIANVREYHYAGKEQWQATWCPAVFNATGAQFTMAIGANGSDSDVASMMAMASSSSTSTGWFRWAEGNNEPNNNFGSGVVPAATTVTVQQDIFSNCRSTNNAAFPVTPVGPSLIFGLPNPETGGPLAGYLNSTQLSQVEAAMALANVHFYPSANPDVDDNSGRGGEFDDVKVGLGNFWGGKPQIITEWHPTLYATDGSKGDDQQDAYRTPIFLLNGYRLGYSALFWFALYDWQEPTQSGYMRVGFWPNNFGQAPRPVANTLAAMYNLTGDLAVAFPGVGGVTDNNGGLWTITAGGVVDLAGAAVGNTANATQIALDVNNVMFYQNSSAQWFSWNGTAWNGPATAPTIAGSLTRRSFGTSKFNYSIVGLPAPTGGAPNAGGHHALFENSSGTFFLFVWNEQTALSPSTVKVTITANSTTPKSITEYNLTSGTPTTPLQSLSNVSSWSTQLDTSVRLFVIQYGGGAVGTAPGAPSTLVATAETTSSISYTWQAPTGTSPFTYNLQYRVTGAASWLNAPASMFSGGSNSSTGATITGLSAGTSYDARVNATNSIGTGPFSATTVVSTTAAATTGPGPAATSGFVTVEFSTNVNMPNGSGPVVIDPKMFGIATAAALDNNFQIMADATFQSTARSLPTSLVRFNCNSGGAGGNIFSNTFPNGPNGTPDWTVWNNFINNIGKCVDLANCYIIIGVGFPDTGGLSNADFAHMTSLTVTHLRNTAPSGGGSPINPKGWEYLNEPGTVTAAAFNAFVDAVNGVGTGYTCFGPTSANDFGLLSTLISGRGGRSFVPDVHEYLWCAGSDPQPTDAQIAQAVTGGSGTSPLDFASNINSTCDGSLAGTVPFLNGEWNMECAAATINQEQNIIGAMFAVNNLFKQALNINRQLWGAMWEWVNDGTYGIIQGSAIDPAGYTLSKCYQHMPGTMVRTTLSAAPSCAGYASQSGTNFGAVFTNWGGSAQSGQVALSHWPLNASGSATIHVWTLTNTNGAGVVSTVSVTNGVTGTITFPANSVVVLYP